MKLSGAGNFCTTNGELRAGAAGWSGQEPRAGAVGGSCGRELRAGAGRLQLLGEARKN